MVVPPLLGRRSPVIQVIFIEELGVWQLDVQSFLADVRLIPLAASSVLSGEETCLYVVEDLCETHRIVALNLLCFVAVLSMYVLFEGVTTRGQCVTVCGPERPKVMDLSVIVRK